MSFWLSGISPTAELQGIWTADTAVALGLLQLLKGEDDTPVVCPVGLRFEGMYHW